jgi:TonB family protein
MEKKQKNGAAHGGNIALIVACLAIILLPLVGWFIAGPLLLAAFICSIVAIAQNAARQGIVLMFGSILMPIIAQLVGIAMWAGIGAAGSNGAKKQQQTPQSASAAYNTANSPPLPVPTAVFTPRPVYRPDWAKQGLAGKGVVLVTIDQQNGKVSGARMLQSTGNKQLDGAALEAYSQWPFQPGTGSQVKIPFEFATRPKHDA